MLNALRTADAHPRALRGVKAGLMTPRRRARIEGEIELHLQRVELLIARLDCVDAVTDDLEDDDPAGDPLVERGEAPTDDGADLLKMLPIYGVDQTVGPINECAATRAHYAEQIA